MLPFWSATVVSGMLCLVALAVIVFSSRHWLWWLISGLLILLFVIDQHRLQPWAYQTAIYATVFASMSPAAARRWLVPLAASVYIYSAAGKFDYQFVHTVGIDFLRAIAGPVGGLPDEMPISTRSWIAFLFPVSEIAIGILLLLGPTRRWAGIGAMFMHASLMAILGPWGLNHSAGVLLWNVLLTIQAWFLFVGSAHSGERAELTDPQRPMFHHGAIVAKMLVVLAMLMPVFERHGYWDHWPSWALYSPHNSRLDAEIHRSGVRLLPAEMRTLIEPDANGDGWQTLSLDRWSLDTRRVPIYPQSRYQLGLAVAIAESRDIDDQIRGRLRSVSNRRTGKRSEKLLLGRTELQQATKNFWLLP